MKKIIQVIMLIVSIHSYSQLDANSVMGLPIAETISEMEAITPNEEGAIVYNRENKRLYFYQGLVSSVPTWRKVIIAPVVTDLTGDYTLAATDDGNILAFDSTTDVTLTIPTGLTSGYNISIYQKGAGQVNIVNDTGVTLVNRLSRFYTAGAGAGVGLVALDDDEFYLTGDLKRM